MQTMIHAIQYIAPANAPHFRKSISEYSRDMSLRIELDISYSLLVAFLVAHVTLARPSPGEPMRPHTLLACHCRPCSPLDTIRMANTKAIPIAMKAIVSNR